jgi:DNA-binding IclR family transcriptional regulator
MLHDNDVRSVDRAAALLLALGEMPGEASVTELAIGLGFHKSTASRLLATLEKRGLVEQDPTSRKFRLGPAVVRLGAHAERSLDLRSIAKSELESLARSIGETTTLEILQSDRALTIACSYASGRGPDRTARNSPLHASAPGKVLLASGPEREVIRLSLIGFIPYTSHTIVRVEVLLEELARVRRRGFATDFGEHEPTVNAIAVPVFDRRACVAAALEVRASGNRITPHRVLELVDRAREAAAVITGRMGGVVASI